MKLKLQTPTHLIGNNIFVFIRTVIEFDIKAEILNNSCVDATITHSSIEIRANTLFRLRSENNISDDWSNYAFQSM